MTEKTESAFYLGIDPGASGGLAIVDSNSIVIDASPMPDTEHDCAEYLREFAPSIRMAQIEAVTPMKQQGLGSTWKFGQNYGFLRGLLVALQIPFEGIRPQEWQGALQIAKRGDKTKTEHKNVLKARAQQIWPHKKWTLATCDAALIAEHCRRRHAQMKSDWRWVVNEALERTAEAL